MISARTQILFGRSSLILYFVQYHVSFCLFPPSVATFILIEICKYLNVADWTDIYGMHQRTILRSSYRGIAWVRFDPMKTEFRLVALTDWVIRPWIQLVPRDNFVQLLQFHIFFCVWLRLDYCICQSLRLF